jgi:hypothetical protein
MGLVLAGYGPAMTSAAWFQDPTERHEFRYWDGGRWSEHVSDQGIVSVDPLPQAAGSDAASVAAQVADVPARLVYVDTEVRYSFKRKRLLVDEVGIRWGDDAWQFGAISAYSHWITHKMAAGNHSYEYRIRLWAEGRKPVTIVFIGKDEGLRQAYESAIQALWQYSGHPRLEDVIGRVSAGQEVELAEWTVSQAGAKRGRKSLTWNEPIELRPSNVFAGHMVYVTREGKSKQLNSISSESQDGPLCRRVFEVLRQGIGV